MPNVFYQYMEFRNSPIGIVVASTDCNYGPPAVVVAMVIDTHIVNPTWIFPLDLNTLGLIEKSIQAYKDREDVPVGIKDIGNYRYFFVACTDERAPFRLYPVSTWAKNSSTWSDEKKNVHAVAIAEDVADFDNFSKVNGYIHVPSRLLHYFEIEFKGYGISEARKVVNGSSYFGRK